MRRPRNQKSAPRRDLFEQLEERRLFNGAFAPTLTAIKPFKTAIANVEFPITFAQLAANANEADADLDAITFKIAGLLANNVVKINGVLAVVGDEITPGDTVTWQGPIQKGGTRTAFTVKAFDNTHLSATPVAVRVFTQLKPAVGVDIVKPNASELTGNTTGTGKWVFTRIGENYSQAQTVAYTITGTAANDGSDITQVLPGTIVIPAGKRSVTLTVNPIDDGVPEGNETLILTVVNNVASDYLVNPFHFKSTVTIADNNHIPTFNTNTPIAGALLNTPFDITFAAFVTATGAADADADAISLKIVSVASGTLKRNGVAVVPGTTIFAAGDTLTWTPPNNATGTLNAFTVAATDSGTTFTAGKLVRITVT